MSVRRRTRVLCTVGPLLFTFISCASCADGDDPDVLILARNGRTDYHIVIAENASPHVKAVARDSQQIFTQMSGAAIPLVTDAEPMGDREIIVGPSKHLDNLVLRQSSMCG